jgi:hypothetical protein
LRWRRLPHTEEEVYMLHLAETVQVDRSCSSGDMHLVQVEDTKLWSLEVWNKLEAEVVVADTVAY